MDDPRAGSAGARSSRAARHWRAAGLLRNSLPPPAAHRLQAGIGGVSAEETHIALCIPVDDVPPAIGTVDVAIVQGAAFEHAELVEQEVRVVAGAVEVPDSGRHCLSAVGRAEGAIRIQHDLLQPVAIMEVVDLLPGQVGTRRPVL